tara:strand:- start:222 stop:386 length:165 start_codon:yes stop_codon:yes gene_type:complete
MVFYVTPEEVMQEINLPKQRPRRFRPKLVVDKKCICLYPQSIKMKRPISPAKIL